MTTIHDVAARAGVSVATVSRVINGSDPVSEDLQQRVRQAIAELDYQPSGIARSMRGQSQRAIGVIIADILNPFFTRIVKAIEEIAYHAGYSVILCNSGEDPEKERRYLEFLKSERVAGIILAPTSSQLLQQSPGDQPIVILDRGMPDQEVDRVYIDNLNAMRQAVRHLIDLGHRRIGMVAGPPNLVTASQRLLGYQTELESWGIDPQEQVIEYGDFTEHGGLLATWRLLQADPCPTAVLIANNLMTIGALRSLAMQRVEIPQQISLVGFDDMNWYPLMSPPVTALRQPLHEIGQEAADLLLRRIAGDFSDFPHERSFAAHLVVRGSTSRPLLEPAFSG